MVRIYGGSDDFVEIEGHPDGDEVGCYERSVHIRLGDTESGGCLVVIKYGGLGLWTAKISQLDEGVLIPWPISVYDGRRADSKRHSDGGYSVVVEIDCPPSVPLSWKTKQNGGR